MTEPLLPVDLCGPPDTDHDATRRSFHLTMRDGVRIAADLWLPAAAAGERRLTTAVRSTRYWRARVGDPLAERLGTTEVARWTRAGFALMLIDARGTGASYGRWARCWDDDQRDDLYEICDWLISQPWSDGNVVGYGTSYDGTTAHLLAATGHPAVKAVVPRFALYDAYAHIAFPGGVPADWFLSAWDAGNWHLDGYPECASAPPAVAITGDVRPVDDDADGQLLADARREHAGNWRLWQAVRDAVSREDIRGDDGIDNDAGTPYGRIDALRTAKVPMWLWTAWYDGAYAAAALAQLADPALDVRVTIGPWSHGANFPPLGDPLQPNAPISPAPREQQQQMAEYLRQHATGEGPDPNPHRLRYYTLGDGWHDSAQWPPTDTEIQRHYLGPDGELRNDARDGSRRHQVDFTASTGRTTRWHTLIGGPPVRYPDRRTEDEKLLTYDGQPLLHATEITGTPAVALTLRTDAPDCALFCYLEMVSSDGTVTYLTEGQLRAGHRKPGTGAAPYETYGPWHTFSAADYQPMIPGEWSTLEFTMWPISVLVPASHHVRIAIAGADAGLFRRIPNSADVLVDVAGSSCIDLPIRRAAGPIGLLTAVRHS